MAKKNSYKICVAGAVNTEDCSLDVLEVAKDLGKAIAKNRNILVTGSQGGFPMFSAMGAKEKLGKVIYFSPAANEKEHTDGYRLPVDHSDMVIYTGFGFVGADILMTRSVDAVILGFGKIDAVHEFTMALKEGKPIGVLKGEWHTDDIIKELVGENPPSHMPIVFDDDPDRLVEKLIELI